MEHRMLFPIKDTITKRKSVRSFDGNPLNTNEKEKLEQFIQTIPNPWDVPVEFKLLDAKEYHLSSPVITGTDLYMAAKTVRCKYYEIGYGYSFETACLYAKSIGIGTVILAGTLNRAAFEKAMDVQDNEVMPVASPVGYPASKRTVRETLMRKGIKADERIPFETMFYDGSFDKGLKKENAGIFQTALEMARWSPSAGNKQPFRAVVTKDTVHFYEKKSMKDSLIGDIQKVDIGIGLAHFDLTMQEEGCFGHFVDKDPGLSSPKNTYYIISYEK